MPSLSVLLIDDSPAFLAAAGTFLSGFSAVAVIGTASSGEAGVSVERFLLPDMVLMDLSMPGVGGLEATRRIKSAANPPRVVILTLHDADAYRAAALAAGADGFISKARLATDLLPLIETLFPGLARGEKVADGHWGTAREGKRG